MNALRCSIVACARLVPELRAFSLSLTRCSGALCVCRYRVAVVLEFVRARIAMKL
jgi:hypothetical protein